MKFKFSVTVITDNEILQIIIKQSLLTKNVRKLSNNCQLMEKYKTDLIAMPAFLLIFIQNLIIIIIIYYIKMISIKKRIHESFYSCKLDTKRKEPKFQHDFKYH